MKMHVIHWNQSVAGKWTENGFCGPLFPGIEIKGRIDSKFNNCFAILIFKILKCP